MSADLPFTRDRANLIARAEQVATPCRVFRVEAHGSYHVCEDCQQSEAAHIIRALLDEMARREEEAWLVAQGYFERKEAWP